MASGAGVRNEGRQRRGRVKVRRSTLARRGDDGRRRSYAGGQSANCVGTQQVRGRYPRKTREKGRGWLRVRIAEEVAAALTVGAAPAGSTLLWGGGVIVVDKDSQPIPGAVAVSAGKRTAFSPSSGPPVLVGWPLCSTRSSSLSSLSLSLAAV